MNSRQRATLVQIIGQVSDPEPTPADDHLGAQAEVVCDTCHRFLTWAAVEVADEDCGFRCAACMAATRQSAARRRLIRMLRSPLTYVILLVVMSGVLFAAGVGRLQPRVVQQRDALKPWFRHRLPRLHALQGGRVRMRVLVLEEEGHRSEVARWARLGNHAFNRAADLWQGTDAEPHLRVAATVMSAYTGDTQVAHATLKALAPDYPPDSKEHLSYLFYRGRIALAAGDRQAAIDDLESVLRGIGSGREKMLDLSALELLLEADQQAMGEAAMVRRMAEISGLNLQGGYMAREIIALFKAQGIRSLVANKVEREMKEAGAWNRRGESVIVEPARR